MTIPECRDALLAIANSLAIKGLADEARGLRLIVNEMTRRPAIRKTVPKSMPMTPDVRDAIRAYARAHPDASNQEIGNVFQVNTGRVSESLAGFRR
jgi:hypothetical protein